MVDVHTTYNKKKLYVRVMDSQPQGKAKNLRDISPVDFANAVKADFKNAYESKGRIGCTTMGKQGNYVFVYRIGMYGTIMLSVYNEENLKELVENKMLELYLFSCFNYALEHIVYPVVEEGLS